MKRTSWVPIAASCGGFALLVAIGLRWKLNQVEDQFLKMMDGQALRTAFTVGILDHVRSGDRNIFDSWRGVGLGEVYTNQTALNSFRQYAAKYIFSYQWLNTWLLPYNLRWLGLFGQLDSTEAKFCHKLLDYMWVSPHVSGLSYPAVYADKQAQVLWIEKCRQEYPNLSEEEKALLAKFHESGDIPMEMLVPPVPDNEHIKWQSRREGAFVEESHKFTREEIKTMLTESVALSHYSHFLKEPSESILDYFDLLEIREAPQIEGTWKAVGDAIKKGRITKFNCADILPKEFVNVSFEQMLEWEGEEAAKIPIFMDGRTPHTYKWYMEDHINVVKQNGLFSKYAAADERMCCRAPKVHEGGSTMPGISREIEGWVESTPYSGAGYIHTKRLPGFHSRMPQIEGPMGIQDDVLRGQSQLWMGPTPGGFHYDEEANVYLQLTGYTLAFLVPQNYTSFFTGAIRHPWGSSGLPNRQEIAADPYIKQVPIYMIPLHAGEGITLQGRTYHRFFAQTQDRIALNWFFIPGWRKMEYTPADWYSEEAARSLPRLALRQLWSRTLARLFDDTGRGVIYMGTKLEYV